MLSAHKMRVDDEEGFVFVMALLLMFIMTSLAVLIFALTSRDVRVAVRSTCEKICSNSADNGTQELIRLTALNGVSTSNLILPDTLIDPLNNATSMYSISQYTGNVTLENDTAIAPGYEMGGTGSENNKMANKVIQKTVTGTDTRCGSRTDLDLAVGYMGPAGATYPAAGG